MVMRNRIAVLVSIVAFAAGSCSTTQPVAKGPRVSLLHCGTISAMDPTLFGLKKEEITGDASFVTPCYLIVHPKGTLIWDVGQVADANIPDDGTEVVEQNILKAK